MFVILLVKILVSVFSNNFGRCLIWQSGRKKTISSEAQALDNMKYEIAAELGFCLSGK